MQEQQYVQSVLHNASIEIYLQMCTVQCICIIQGDFEKVLFFNSLRDRKKSTHKKIENLPVLLQNHTFAKLFQKNR